MPTPGEHRIVSWPDALQARREGWVIRDTLLVIGPDGLQAWALVRWPLDGTVVETVLKHGCGGINIGACRIRHASQADLDHHRDMVERIKAKGGSMANSWKNSSDLSGASEVSAAGRWPPNVLMMHGPGCRLEGSVEVASDGHYPGRRGPSGDFAGDTGGLDGQEGLSESYTAGEVVPVWDCGCLVAALDGQSGESGGGALKANVARSRGTAWRKLEGRDLERSPALEGTASAPDSYGDAGGASRFFPQFQDDAGARGWAARLIGGVVPPHG